MKISAVRFSKTIGGWTPESIAAFFAAVAVAAPAAVNEDASYVVLFPEPVEQNLPPGDGIEYEAVPDPDDEPLSEEQAALDAAEQAGAVLMHNGMMCVPFYTQDISVVDREKMILRHVISSGKRSDTGLEIVQSGWNLSEYHGTVMWDHGSVPSIPTIGKNLDLSFKGSGKNKKLHAVTQFAPTAFARDLFGLYADGYMTDWSVGVYLDKTETIEEGDRYVGLRAISTRLKEYSGTHIGANSDAVTQAAKKGIIRPETAVLLTQPFQPASASQSALPPEELPDSLRSQIALLDFNRFRLATATALRRITRRG